jgi:hypothetical protein
MPISSPSKSSGFESSFNSDLPVAIEEKTQRAESTSVVRSVASSYTSNGSSPRTEKARPWKGPLPKPRVSPKLSIGDAIEKAKIVQPSPSVVVAFSTRWGFKCQGISAGVGFEFTWPIQNLTRWKRYLEFKFQKRVGSIVGCTRQGGFREGAGKVGPPPKYARTSLYLAWWLYSLELQL